MPMTIEEAKDCITLLLTTCPHPCRLRKLLRDFRKLKGHNMPLFGFDSHLELLKSFDDIVVVLDSGNERNPEIRLIRRDPLPPMRARDIFPGLDDEREIESEPPTNGPRIHNPNLPDVLILQDEAAAYMFTPEPLPHSHIPGLGHGHSHAYAHAHGYAHAHSHAHGHAHGHGHSHRHEARPQSGDFGSLDDGMGSGVEEEEHLDDVWDVEREMSVTFLMRLCMHWMFEGVKRIWNKFTHGFGRFG